MSPDLLSVTLRAAAFVALFQAAGAAFFLAKFGAGLGPSRAPIARLGRLAALTAVPLVLAHQLLDAARMAGEFAGSMDASLQRLAWYSGSGVMHLVQVAGMLLVAVGLRTAQASRGPRLTAHTLAFAGAVLAMLSFLLTGHTSVHPLRYLLAPLLGLHLLIIAFWFGALAPLCLVLTRDLPAAAVRTMQGFSALAVWLVPLILVAGLGMACLLVPGLAVLQLPYGQLLAVKLAGFGTLMGFAILNRSRLVPALANAHRAGSTARALRRSIATEYGVLVAVLAVTAVLTSYFSPDH